ncbi:MAG: nucleotidyltransferase domain-containing protein [Desulfatiglandaceae bacterium]
MDNLWERIVSAIFPKLFLLLHCHKRIFEKMRLTSHEKESIKKAVAEKDPGAVIYLFGSRVDDRARGGDIDILVLSNHLTLADKLSIKARIFEILEEQKLDMIIARDTNDPFVKSAVESGARL